MFPGEVQIDLSARVREDFLPKFGKDIAQKLLFFLGFQLVDLIFDLLNGHVFPLLWPYSISLIASTIISKKTGTIV